MTPDPLQERVARIEAWLDDVEGRRFAYHDADKRIAADVRAVLADLREAGELRTLEQVGGLCACGFVRTEDMVPANNPLGQFGHVIPGEAPDFCGPVVPVYIVREDTDE